MKLLAEKFDSYPIYRQAVQDTLAFRSQLPIWMVDQCAIEAMSKDELGILNFCEDVVTSKTVIEGMEKIFINLDYWVTIYSKYRNKVLLTSYSNNDALTNLFKGFLIWEIWEFVWSIHHSDECWKSDNKESTSLFFSTNNDSNSDFGHSLISAITKISVPISNKDDSPRKCSMFAGPLLNVGYSYGDQYNALTVGRRVSESFRVLLNKFSKWNGSYEQFPDSISTGHQLQNDESLYFVLSNERIHAAANLRQAVTGSELCSRLSKASRTFKRTFLSKIVLGSFETIPHDYLMGHTGAIYFWQNVNENLKRKTNSKYTGGQLLIKMPTLIDRKNLELKAAWTKIKLGSNKAQFTLDCSGGIDISTRNKGHSGRVLILRKDNQFVKISDVKHQKSEVKLLSKIDNAFSESLNTVRTSRNNFLLEQTNLVREWLNDNITTWVRGRDQIEKLAAKDFGIYHPEYSTNSPSTQKTSMEGSWSKKQFEDTEFPPAMNLVLEKIALLCFRLFRGDHFSLYFYEDRNNQLTRVGGVNNSKPSAGTYESVDQWPEKFKKFAMNSVDDLKLENKERSLAYRCLKQSLKSTSLDDGVKASNWVKNLESDTPLNEGIAMPTGPEGGYIAPARTEIAVDLRINGRTWGVMILSGYFPYQFEAAAQQSLNRIGRLFAYYVYQTWSSSKLNFLARFSLLGKYVPKLYVGEHADNFDWGGVICNTLSDLLLVSGTVFWIRIGSTNTYKAIGISNYKGSGFNDVSRDELLNTSKFIHSGSIETLEQKAVSYSDLGCPEHRPDVWCVEGKVGKNEIDRYFDQQINVASKKSTNKLCVPLIYKDGNLPLGVLTVYSTASLNPGFREHIQYVRDGLTSWFAAMYVRKDSERQAQGLLTHSIDHEMMTLERVSTQTPSYTPVSLRDRSDYIKMSNDLSRSVDNLNYSVDALLNGEWLAGLPAHLMRPNNTERIDIREMLSGILKTNEFKLGKNVENYVDSRLWVNCSEAVLSIIFHNFIDNAKKYMQEGTQLRVRVFETHKLLRISCLNIGHPLDPDEWKNINQMEMFGVRGRHSLRSNERGHGYGLGVVSKLSKEWGLNYSHKTFSVNEKKVAFEIRPEINDSGEWVNKMVPKRNPFKTTADIKTEDFILEETERNDQNTRHSWHSFSIDFDRERFGYYPTTY